MTTPTMIKSGLLLLAFASLSSCIATPKEGDATLAFYQKAKSSTSATTGVGAFNDTYYAFARANCAVCHGVSQAPLFATGDVNASYSVAKDTTFVNFSFPSSSKLAVYSGNGHCGTPGCQSNATVATDAIKSWAAVELAANTGGTGGSTGSTGGTGAVGGGPVTGGANSGSFVTTAVNIPATLPTGVTYVPMRWPLSALTPTSALMAGAIFELEVQKLSATTYRVRNPKIAGLKSAVRVTGIHVFVKPATDVGIGVEDLGAGSVWENDVVTVPATTLPATLPTGALSTTTFVPLDPYAMVIGIRSNQDAFTVSFDKIETAIALTATFASINLNILGPKCINCHKTGNAAAGVNYDSYNNTIATGGVSKGNPAGSALFTSTTGTNPRMPTGSIKLTTAETTAISSWITANALNN